MFKIKVQNNLNGKEFGGEFKTEQEALDWYSDCGSKGKFGENDRWMSFGNTDPIFGYKDVRTIDIDGKEVTEYFYSKDYSYEITDITEETNEREAVIKKQMNIAFGNKMVALISVMAEELESSESLALIQKYNHILSYLQFGFLDTASMEIAKVSVQDDNGIEARLKHRLLQEISKYLG